MMSQSMRPRRPRRGRPGRSRARAGSTTRAPAGSRALDRAVGAAAVDDDDLVDRPARDGGEHAADRLFLVQGRDDQRDPRPSSPVHRLQRSPQPAQAGGGWSLSSALRKAW